MLTQTRSILCWLSALLCSRSSEGGTACSWPSAKDLSERRLHHHSIMAVLELVWFHCTCHGPPLLTQALIALGRRQEERDYMAEKLKNRG